MQSELERLEKSEKVTWQEFKIGDLFEIEKTASFNKDRLTEGGEYDYVTRTSQNYGILQSTGFVNQSNINSSGSWSLGLLQMDFFYRSKPWYAGQFVRKITPKLALTRGRIQFFSSLLTRQKKKLLSVLVRDVDEVFRNGKTLLPVVNGKIAFNFIENFIEILEAERLETLDAYLVGLGLKDYNLTPEEQKALDDFENVSWKEFRIGELFYEVKLNSIYPKFFNKERDISKARTQEFDLPLVNAKHGDNGIMYYGRSTDFESAEMTIGIVGDGAIATGDVNPHPQKTGVLYNAYLVKPNLDLIQRDYLFFFSSALEKSIKLKFGYENKAGWNKVQKEKIQLPIISNGNIDYTFMQNYVSAVQKTVIKDVVVHLDKRLSALKGVLSL